MLAYGFDMEQKDDHVILRLNAVKDRNIIIREHEDRMCAFIQIGSLEGILERIYVMARDGKAIPTVDYVEIFARSVQNGEELYEKLTP